MTDASMKSARRYWALLLIFLTWPVLGCRVANAANVEEDPLLGVYEGWAWPAVVVPPPEGWDSPVGESIKYAFRAAEREISMQREGIRGREVTFMFATLDGVADLRQRLQTWRGMNVSVIVSFADDEMNAELLALCRAAGPSVIFAGGEDILIKDPASGKPNPYLFALDLPYYARANALAEVARTASDEGKLTHVAVITDVLSKKLARGAELNVTFLRKKNLEVMDLAVAGLRQDQYVQQVGQARAEGAGVITTWLDAMATLSIWRTASMRPEGPQIYYAGNQQRILLDAEGLVIVDKDVLLERDEGGKHGIIVKVRDLFNRESNDPVLSAKAYALGKWVIHAYQDTQATDIASIARALARVENIPLMDELLSISPNTNRPKMRKFGVLQVVGRQYRSAGSVEVFSEEVSEQ